MNNKPFNFFSCQEYHFILRFQIFPKITDNDYVVFNIVATKIKLTVNNDPSDSTHKGTYHHHLQSPSKTFNHHQLPSTTINHHQPPSTTINHHQLPSTTINHLQLPSTTINYHQLPSTTIVMWQSIIITIINTLVNYYKTLPHFSL
ncbi:hypothetical protein ACTA71_011484 [Dictyostelium dimigraforme]